MSNHLANGSPTTSSTAGVLKWLTNLFSAGGDDSDELAATESALQAANAVAVVSHDDFPSQNVDGGHVCV